MFEVYRHLASRQSNLCPRLIQSLNPGSCLARNETVRSNVNKGWHLSLAGTERERQGKVYGRVSAALGATKSVKLSQLISAIILLLTGMCSKCSAESVSAAGNLYSSIANTRYCVCVCFRLLLVFTIYLLVDDWKFSFFFCLVSGHILKISKEMSA